MGLKLGSTSIPLIKTTYGTGEWTTEAFIQGLAPSGSITINTSSISAYAFMNNKVITSVAAPNCISLGTYAFYNNSMLTHVSMSQASVIGNNAFQSCTNLLTVTISGNFSTANAIGASCFYDCSSLTEVNFTGSGAVGINSIAGGAFGNCINLSSIDFTKFNSLKAQALFRNTGITSVYAPNATNVGYWESVFMGCLNLSYVRAPKSTQVLGRNTFNGDVALQLVDIKNSTITGGSVFYNCSALKTLILRNTSVMTIAGGGSANFTGVSSCNVYVPSALKASYESATN